MDLSYIINELGEEGERHLGSVVPPIFQTSNFCFPDVAAMRHSLAREMDAPFYTRGHNPTVAVLRKKVAALAGAEEALVFASGSAAIAAAVMSQLKAGDHVVCVQKPYSWTHKLLTKLLSRFGVNSTFIDGRDPQTWADAVQPNTRLFMMESPNSMTFELQDIPAVVAIAKKHGIHTVMDNSYASPLNQRPIEMGIDTTVHSASKYLAGHSDLVAGVLCTSRANAEKIFQGEYMTMGGIISPNDAWLMIRGLRTLPLRMERVAASTPKVVEFLQSHPKVEKVIYPFSPEFPQYDLARKQMQRGTGQFSILLKADDIAACERFCDALKRFLMACSWGGYESLIFPICTLYNSMNYGETELPWNFIRFYVGLEEPDVLIADLKQALEKV
jgi:cystathionine beta-lyase/cystathionine gamma-synthase